MLLIWSAHAYFLRIKAYYVRKKRIFIQSGMGYGSKMLSAHLILSLLPLAFEIVTPRPSPLFAFPAGKDCYEIETEDWILVSCPNGKTSFKIKTKEITIDGGKIINSFESFLHKNKSFYSYTICYSAKYLPYLCQ